ncbi:MAG: carbohydrate kinase [Spirochaetaceae bacterium]
MEKIVGLGEILWDLFPDGAILGGAPTNFAYHVNSLGLEAFIVSSIGKDARGAEAKQIFADKKIKYIVNEVNQPTGTVMVELDSDGKATYDFTKDSAWDFMELTLEAEKLAKECSCVCFGSLFQRSDISRRSMYRFLGLTQKECIRIFDINIRGDYYSKKVIADSLKYATVLKLNDEEFPLLQEMFGLPKNDDEALKTLKEMYSLDLIILTMGGDGSRLYRSTSEDSFVIPDKTNIVDTVGAGDSFTAAVAVGLIKGDDLDSINRHANKVAGFVCTQKGGTPPLPKL